MHPYLRPQRKPERLFHHRPHGPERRRSSSRDGRDRDRRSSSRDDRDRDRRSSSRDGRRPNSTRSNRDWDESPSRDSEYGSTSDVFSISNVDMSTGPSSTTTILGCFLKLPPKLE